MLQGHFIALTFDDYFIKGDMIRSQGFSDNLGFDLWFQLRSLTAPMFFTVTGLVFVYLLMSKPELKFIDQPRVRKGVRRAFYIMFWGYFLQLNYKNLNYYLSGRINERFFGFHVLQSIGMSILLLIIVYGLYQFIKKYLKFYQVLLIVGLVIFLFNPLMRTMDGYFPSGAPTVIQNMFKGPNSFFPMLPWFGFVCIGGSIGAYLRKDPTRIRSRKFINQFILFGGIVSIGGIGLMFVLDLIFPGNGLWTYKVPFIQIGFMFLALGLLMRLEPKLNSSDTTLMKMGQNTLFIYVLHAILLHGAVIGIGIRTWYEHSISFPMAMIGAILFVLFFAILVRFLPYYSQLKSYLKSKVVRSDHS